MKEKVRIWFEEIFAKGDFSRLEEIVSPKYVDGPNHEGITGPDFLRAKYAKLENILSDVKVEIKDLIAEDNKVVAHYIISATHSGSYLGLEPTGKRFTQEGMTILEFEDDKVVYTFGVYDRRSIIKQLTGDPK